MGERNGGGLMGRVDDRCDRCQRVGWPRVSRWRGRERLALNRYEALPFAAEVAAQRPSRMQRLTVLQDERLGAAGDANLLSLITECAL
jgi:hypothetical protein